MVPHKRSNQHVWRVYMKFIDWTKGSASLISKARLTGCSIAECRQREQCQQQIGGSISGQSSSPCNIELCSSERGAMEYSDVFWKSRLKFSFVMPKLREP